MTISGFYDALAPYYRFIFEDWQASVQRQAAALDGVIREFLGVDARSVLDAACGIGTQSLGLAELGYRVTASDISAEAVARAQQEAAARGLELEFQVSDMRNLWPAVGQQFDVVIACDNAIPHLPGEAEVLAAFQAFYKCCAPGGGCIISVRDYAQMEQLTSGERLYPRLSHRTPDGRRVMFDLWEYHGDSYDITMYIVEDKGEATAQTHVVRGGRYYPITTDTLERLFGEAGFRQAQTLRDRFYQPLILALK